MHNYSRANIGHVQLSENLQERDAKYIHLGLWAHSAWRKRHSPLVWSRDWERFTLSKPRTDYRGFKPWLRKMKRLPQLLQQKASYWMNGWWWNRSWRLELCIRCSSLRCYCGCLVCKSILRVRLVAITPSFWCLKWDLGWADTTAEIRRIIAQEAY